MSKRFCKIGASVLLPVILAVLCLGITLLGSVSKFLLHFTPWLTPSDTYFYPDFVFGCLVVLCAGLAMCVFGLLHSVWEALYESCSAHWSN